MRFLWLLALVACSKDAPDATKAGTTIVSWKLADSDRVPIRAAKISDNKTATTDFEFHAADMSDQTVKLAITLETATVVFTEDGKEVTHAAPIKVDIAVKDANGFKVEGHPCSGPHYDMAQPPGKDMILQCDVGAKKPRISAGSWIYLYGDGHVDDGRAKK